MVAASSIPSASCAAVTVMVCGTFQLVESKFSLLLCGVSSESTVTSALSLVASMDTLQEPALLVGSAVRTTV